MRRVALATLTIRSPERSISEVSRIAVTTARMSLAIGCWRASTVKQRSSMSRVEGVDLVVAVDDLLRGGEVEVEQRVGAAGDDLGHPGGQPDEVAPDLVELLVERRAATRSRRGYRTSAARWAGSPVIR